MRISEVMGINKSPLELDFYDYEIDKDTELFFDPYYISKKDDAFLLECNDYIDSFFNQFIFLLKKDEAKAFSLFLHLGEVNEICLGMSSGTPSGKGIGNMDATHIFEAIKNSSAVQNNILEHLEDIRLFVEGVDKDKISDMVANIIKYPLIKYTINQCKLYGVPMQQVETGYYWNKSKWDRSYEDMLVYKAKHYLLFPRNLLTDSKKYCADQYYRMYILDHLKIENIKKDTHLVHRKIDKFGKVVAKYVYKKEINREICLSEATNRVTKDWIARFTKENPGVLEKYRAEAIENIVVYDEEISEEDYDNLIDSLIMELNDIPVGTESASRYHHLISGILELLFYPSIAHPRIEQSIHDGRKRLDIVFDNIAEQGFFYRLHNIHNIPDALIMVECKNYRKDIKNPELDQMAGRFSPKRGKFGIICCRSLDDSKLFVERERDTVHDDRGYIIHLTDEDIIKMLTGIKTGKDGQRWIDTFMNSKVIELII